LVIESDHRIEQMPKHLSQYLSRIMLLLACLWLSACGLSPENISAPVLDGPLPFINNESSSKIDESLPAAKEKDALQLPSNQSLVVLHLPYVSVRDDMIMECLSPEAQGLGSSIAGNYGISGETVMDWYCTGYAFEDILLALQTAAQVNVSPQDLLDRLSQGQTWDGIWGDIGLLE
jgi:hypothetical protein